MSKTDLISRQLAIDALGDKPLAWTEGEYELGLQNQWQSDVDALKALPSAEPEIIRCKDCKHKHLENMVWTCPFGLPGGENFFCGYGAEPYKGE